MDITIVVKYYQIRTYHITGSLEEKLKFLLQKTTSPQGRSKLCKGSNIAKDDKNELKILN